MAELIAFEGGFNVAFSPPTDQSAAITALVNVRNVSPEAHVVIKVKTSNAERYIVKPHIALLRPLEQRDLSVSVQSSQGEAFMEEMTRQAATGHKRTVFLVLVWPLNAEIAAQLARSDAGKLSATLNALWHEEEEHSRATRSSPFKTIKLTASCDLPAPAAVDMAASGGSLESKSSAAPVEPVATQALGDAHVVNPSVETPIRTGTGEGGVAATPAMVTAPSTATRPSLDQRPVAVTPPVEAPPPAPRPPAPAPAAADPRRVQPAAAPAVAAAPRGAEIDTTAMVEEVMAIRQKYNDLAAQAVLLRGERDSLAKALAVREHEVEQALQEAQSGLRLRKPVNAPTAAAGAAPDDDDDLVREAPGFPLWQVILVALIMFLIGYFANLALAP